jgi:hypothetical protein
MSFFKKSASAFGKLIVVIILAATFVVGLVGVVYMSLQGQALTVPEIVGKDLVESEKELASMGLRIKKRADRYSTEKPNTVLEQLPKAGETVKTGQMILVVTSKTNPEGDEKPVTIKKNVEELDDSEKIEELISDKPKKTNKTNTNASNSNKKKSSTTRDVLSNNSNENSNSSSSSNANSNTKSGVNTDEKSNKNASTNSNKPANSNKSNSNVGKPNANKPATGGDVRPRRTPQP